LLRDKVAAARAFSSNRPDPAWSSSRRFPVRSKAKANLSAAKLLADRSMYDAAANRLYFALFQCGVECMTRMGKVAADFGRSSKRWDHATIVGNSSLYRGRFSDISLFRDARGLRVQADYETTPVRASVLRAYLAAAEPFFREVCG
jgi:hypothetical protein